jgi:molybdate transport system permease protein
MIDVFLSMDFSPLWLTFQMALCTTLILLVAGTFIALKLAKIEGTIKPFLEAIVALPLVLPPTVIGFYLLMLLSPESSFGQFWQSMGLTPLTFSFAGLVVGSVIYSLPFTVQPLLQGFEQLGKRPIEAAATLGATPVDQFFSIIWPLTRRHYLVAATLTFAHTVGEFGVVLMIGGNIPGVTQVASIAIYDYVDAGEYTQAHILSGIMLILSLVILMFVYKINRRLAKQTNRLENP